MKVIFLDRDGVINTFPGPTRYVETLAEFKLLPGVEEAIALLARRGYEIFVISNQAGVSKGVVPPEELEKMTRHLKSRVKKTGGRIREVLYCIHEEAENCSCRKPKTGLLMKALQSLGKKKKSPDYRCYFVGDTMRDIETGKNAGCRTILVLSGAERWENRANWRLQPDMVVKDLREAAELIIKDEG